PAVPRQAQPNRSRKSGAIVGEQHGRGVAGVIADDPDLVAVLVGDKQVAIPRAQGERRRTGCPKKRLHSGLIRRIHAGGGGDQPFPIKNQRGYISLCKRKVESALDARRLGAIEISQYLSAPGAGGINGGADAVRSPGNPIDAINCAVDRRYGGLAAVQALHEGELATLSSQGGLPERRN